MHSALGNQVADFANVQNGPLLVYTHAFGIQGNVRDNVAYLDEHVVLYPIGRHVTMYNLETKAMTFIRETEKVECITAISVSPNKKQIALCERTIGDTGVPQVSVYNVATEKRLRVLTTPDVASKEFVGASFSSDSKYLITLGGPPDWTLVYWQWIQSKVLNVVKIGTPITRVRFSPWDSMHISVSGPKLLKFFRLQEGVLRAFNPLMGKKEPQDYTDHIWASEERVIAATSSGDVMIFDDGELKHTITCVHPAGNQLLTLVPIARGFLVAGTSGLISIFDKTDQKLRVSSGSMDGRDLYVQSKTLHTNLGPTITSLAVSPSEEVLTACLSNNQVAHMSLANVDMVKEESEAFTYLSCAFHSAAITGMDVCVRKPLLATCSADNTVRLWNYLDRTCELAKVFQEEPLSISCHPSGFHVLIGFPDKLRFFNVFKDDLRLFQDISIKGCREARFSHGGQYFAAVSQTNINIYSTYTLECVGVLKGHTGPVRSVCWSVDDFSMVSGGVDGAVYEWQLKGFRRVEESVLKTCQYSSVAYRSDAASVIACGSDRKVRELHKGNAVHEVPVGINVRLTQLIMHSSDKAFFAGTSNGAVRSYDFPFVGSKADYHEYPAHRGIITRMRVSADFNYLFTASEDGTIFIFDIYTVDHGEILFKKPVDKSVLMDVLLMTKDEVEEKESTLAELETRISELQMQSEYQLHLREQHWTTQMQKLKEDKDAAMAASEIRYDTLRRRKEETEREYQEQIQTLERQHMKAAEELESVYERKLGMEVSRYAELEAQSDDIKYRMDEGNARQRDKHSVETMSLRREYEQKIKEMEESLAEMKKDMDKTKADHDELLRQSEEEYELEINEIREQKKKELEDEKHLSMTYKGETAFLRNKFDSYRQEMDDLKKELRLRDNDIRRLERNCADLERTIALLKKDIAEREESIDKKEKAIGELKSRNKELEKFKFVLDYKLREMKRDIEPRDEQIENMKDQLRQMDDELERDVRNHAALEMTLNDRHAKIDSLNTIIFKLKHQLMEKDRFISMFGEDLHVIVASLESSKWREAIKQLHRTYVRKEGLAKLEHLGQNEEFARQREYMERQLLTAKVRGEMMEHAQHSDLQKKLTENSFLLTEVNTLRQANRAQQKEIDGLRVKLSDMEAATCGETMRPKTESLSASVILRSATPPALRSRPSSAVNTPRSSSATVRRGKVQKGSTMIWGDIVANERNKVTELMGELGENNREIEIQRKEISRLREQVRDLIRRPLNTPIDGRIVSGDAYSTSERPLSANSSSPLPPPLAPSALAGNSPPGPSA
mmetsp:Transcript_38583/g.62503  ORF Transcript_38583/g.62503 Transcript_38583/m.62503 type:complete len:1299 (+) Transcript_38583:248-4144(+)|eukprot:CAMPEP_0184649454 /NCGR_PEP_ID=MMETSP0308-20130426/6828_1 /TAXON_ID=38269 /ORGANISM="Gloeochaete witrockiana, Strain SAG 46.84" /LENGTH=1298 /DNA_ID=CAMNT_0027082195 /DNA_START=106 /DNA_END=4002 /DNA_ORIENTATION=+